MIPQGKKHPVIGILIIGGLIYSAIGILTGTAAGLLGAATAVLRSVLPI